MAKMSGQLNIQAKIKNIKSQVVNYQEDRYLDTNIRQLLETPRTYNFEF